MNHRCRGNSRTCDQHLEDIPEFTWSIVAAGDLREERSEKTEKKAGSPRGWEEDNQDLLLQMQIILHQGI
eukprot:superscaffoldBa00002637_g14869